MGHKTKAGVTLQYNDAAHVHAVTNAGSNTYQYDSNGNQTTRVIGADTFNLIYNAENQLIEVKKNGTTIAQFTFDGDGRRVKSIVNGETIYFAGGHYEFNDTTDEVTKYYFAGASTIAVRKYIVPQSQTLNYLLGDHLGSTSLVTSDTGNLLVETRYKPWGEVRYTTPNMTLPTRYTFTGQYSYIADEATDWGSAGFGLMFYNARWYDPAIGRFVQADSIVQGDAQLPSSTINDVADTMYTALTVNYSEVPVIAKLNTDNRFIQYHGGTLLYTSENVRRRAKIVGVPLVSQVLDRYAYVLNSPVQYTDPTGHEVKGPLATFMAALTDAARELYASAKEDSKGPKIILGGVVAVVSFGACYLSVGALCIIGVAGAVGLIDYINNESEQVLGAAQADAYMELATEISYYIGSGAYDGGSNFSYQFTPDPNKPGWGTFTIFDANGNVVADAYIKAEWEDDIIALANQAIKDWNENNPR